MDDNRRFTFPKNERLCWKRHMDLLFAKGASFVAFPLRVIYLPINRDESAVTVSVLMSVPKKKLKHAVDRNFVKRRIRESYRLRKHDLIQLLSEKDQALLVAYIYLGKEKSSFETIDQAITKAIQIFHKKME